MQTKLPLANIRVLEMEGLGPSKLVGMILADHGAQVTLIGNAIGGTESIQTPETNNMDRGKKSIMLNLKAEAHKTVFEKLLKQTDIILDSYLPTAMAKLGYP